jgi:hypothetical protein
MGEDWRRTTADRRYTVEYAPLGVIVRGAVPLNEVGTMLGQLAYEGYEVVDALLADRLGATFVLATRENSAAWRRQLGIGGEDG